MPFDVNSGAKLSEQCVTATLRFLPAEGAYREETSTVCLGAQPSGSRRPGSRRSCCATGGPTSLRCTSASPATWPAAASSPAKARGPATWPCTWTATGWPRRTRKDRHHRRLGERGGKGRRVLPALPPRERDNPRSRRCRPPRAGEPRTGNNPTYPAGNVWYSGNDNGNDPNDNNDFGYIPGVSTRSKVPDGSGTYPKFVPVHVSQQGRPAPRKPRPAPTDSQHQPRHPARVVSRLVDCRACTTWRQHLSRQRTTLAIAPLLYPGQWADDHVRVQHAGHLPGRT